MNYPEDSDVELDQVLAMAERHMDAYRQLARQLYNEEQPNG